MNIKFCGITNPDDARAALDAGADWIGLNMVAGPRRIAFDVVRDIVSNLPDPGRVVVLLSPDALESVSLQDFADTKDNFLSTVAANANDVSHQYRDRTGAGESPQEAPPVDIGAIHALGVRRLQLYGAVTPGAITRLRHRGFETILVHHVNDLDSMRELDSLLVASGNARPDYVLFDAADATKLGGTGRRANWEAIATARDWPRTTPWPPFLIAGGLTPGNVAEAIQTLRPFGVDASSGVESSPGRKAREKIRKFVDAARAN